MSQPSSGSNTPPLLYASGETNLLSSQPGGVYVAPNRRGDSTQPRTVVPGSSEKQQPAGSKSSPQLQQPPRTESGLSNPNATYVTATGSPQEQLVLALPSHGVGPWAPGDHRDDRSPPGSVTDIRNPQAILPVSSEGIDVADEEIFAHLDEEKTQIMSFWLRNKHIPAKQWRAMEVKAEAMFYDYEESLEFTRSYETSQYECVRQILLNLKAVVNAYETAVHNKRFGLPNVLALQGVTLRREPEDRPRYMTEQLRAAVPMAQPRPVRNTKSSAAEIVVPAQLGNQGLEEGTVQYFTLPHRS